ASIDDFTEHLFLRQHTSAFAIIAMNPWFSVALFATGFIYLLATMALNYFKQDSVGWWLRKCCWSNTVNYRYAETCKGDYYSVAVQNGAGVQVRLPNVLRGQSVHFNIVSTKRPWGVLPVAKIDQPIH
ncbi:membrane protein, partial [Pseudomonas syringae pv. actinidiae ICMP 18807]